MNPDQRFATLDGFRGISAVLVVFLHLHVVGAFIQLPFFRLDDVLLNFFLVLSGFVLTHSHGMKPDFSFKAFLINRFFRLYPLHALMLAVFLFFELVRWIAYNKGLYLNNVPFTGLFAPEQILPNAVLVQAWTTLTEPQSFNYPSGTISIVLYVSLMFGAVCLLSLKKRFLLIACISMAAFGLIFRESDLFAAPVVSGLSCFFAGSITYLVYRQIQSRFLPGRIIMTLLELAMLYAAYRVVMTDLPYRSPLASVLFCGFVLLFAFEGGWVSDGLKSRVCLLLGRLSYAIYMTHAALLFCLSMVFIVAQKVTGLELAPMINGQRFMDTSSVLGNNILVLAAGVAAVALAALAHHYFEAKGCEWGMRLAAGVTKDKPVMAAAPATEKSIMERRIDRAA